MARDLYQEAHKAIRHDLFETSALIAATDFADSAAVATLVARFHSLTASLRHQGEIEDRDIHPLAHRLGGAELDAVEAEHAAVDAELDALVEVFDDLAAAPGSDRWAEARDFYLRFNCYVAAYLLHADREERELMPALAAAADPTTLDRLAQTDVAGPVEPVKGALRDDCARVARAAQDVLEPAEWAKLAG